MRNNLGAAALTVVILVLGLVPAAGGGRLRAVLRSMRSLELNRSDRANHAGGYYVGLIDGGQESHDQLGLRLVGTPHHWIHFKDIGAARFLRHELLQFELKPNVDAIAFGEHFTTNDLGLRDRPYTRDKPPGTFRVLLLGSSMDMGWGVATGATYENLLEDWLNSRAARRGIARRFEVLNLAMAAYSPLHRLDCFARKAAEFCPDMVLYSATRLDTRLLQIHLVGLLQEKVDPEYRIAQEALANAGIDAARLNRDARGHLLPAEKSRVKARLEPWLWKLEQSCVAELSRRCRAAGLPLACLIIPRASEDDISGGGDGDVARIRAIAEGEGLPVFDLSSAFDRREPYEVEIAPQDDHPNALGHRLLFLELGRQIVANRAVHDVLFNTIRQESPPPRTRGE
jgi:hypothetical protein